MKVLTPLEVAEICAVHVTTVYKWIDSGALPAVQYPCANKSQAVRHFEIEGSDLWEILATPYQPENRPVSRQSTLAARKALAQKRAVKKEGGNTV